MDRNTLRSRHEKDKPYHDRYDTIIKELNKDCKTENIIKSNLVDISYLSAKGYLAYTQISNEEFKIKLTPEGHVFIAEGGFKRIRELEWEHNEDIELNREQTKKALEQTKQALEYSFNSNIIAVIAMLITLSALLFEIFCKDK